MKSTGTHITLHVCMYNVPIAKLQCIIPQIYFAFVAPEKIDAQNQWIMDVSFDDVTVVFPATQVESNVWPKGSHHHSILLSITQFNLLHIWWLHPLQLPSQIWADHCYLSCRIDNSGNTHFPKWHRHHHTNPLSLCPCKLPDNSWLCCSFMWRLCLLRGGIPATPWWAFRFRNNPKCGGPCWQVSPFLLISLLWWNNLLVWLSGNRL